MYVVGVTTDKKKKKNSEQASLPLEFHKTYFKNIVDCTFSKFSGMNVKKPKATSLMDYFYSNLEYLQENVLGKKVVTEQVTVDSEQPDAQTVTASLPDQLKHCWKWRGACRLRTSEKPTIITDTMGTSSSVLPQNIRITYH